MKRISNAFSLMLAWCVTAAGEESPRNIRVSMQFIAMPHRAMTELLAGGETGSKLWEEVFALTKDGRARILETGMIACRSGEKALIESVREEIFPIEIEAPVMCGKQFPDFNYSPKQRPITAFEIRNVGTLLEVEARDLEGGGFVELRWVPELVTRLRLETMIEYSDKHGDASIRMPIFETWRTNTFLTLRAGRFRLVSVFSPKQQVPAPFLDSRVLLFVRADVLPVR